MNDDELSAEAEAVLRARLAQLRQEHQDLDDSIHALEGGPRPDQIQIARLKKKKLALRDHIERLEDQLTPDIIA
ncbi:MAG TPA: DUF465 domain-containing protein [Caulobacteraceae bacterium]|nr:DUF465 domain-containing protein [Caulobacteraceae bacterium]